jgi:hypothetical protein
MVSMFGDRAAIVSQRSPRAGPARGAEFGSFLSSFGVDIAINATVLAFERVHHPHFMDQNGVH